MANRGLIALATSAITQALARSKGDTGLLSAGFSVSRIGSDIEVVPQISLRQNNPQMQQYFVSVLTPLCAQIKDYLSSNLELYPTTVNNDSVNYSNGIAVSIAVPFTNPQMIATR